MPEDNKEKTIKLEDDFEFEIKPTKSAIAAVAAGILIILAGFLAYNIFAKPKAAPTITPEAISEENTQGSEQAVNPEATLNQEQVQPAADQSQNVETPSTATTPPADNGQVVATNTTVTTPDNTSVWTALAHAPNSISGSTYTVQSGDTLWEIAQGHYGSGFEWQKIAQANGVQMSPQGYPLIIPGQVLTLP